MSGLLSTLLAPLGLLEAVVRRLERPLLERPARGPALRAAQVLVLARRRCVDDHVGDRAAALAFATLLSCLPLLLLGLGLLGALGYPEALGDVVEAWLFRTFVPEVASSLRDRVAAASEALERTSASLGLAGLVLLVLAASALQSTLARAFARIWGPSGFLPSLRRLAGYWATALGGPALVATSLYYSARIERLAGAAPFGERALELLGYPLATLAAYLYLPGRRVRPLPALAGTVASAAGFELLKRGFTAYVHRALVAESLLEGLGVVPLFLLWLYLVWVSFLFGAEVAHAAQDYAGTRAALAPG